MIFSTKKYTRQRIKLKFCFTIAYFAFVWETLAGNSNLSGPQSTIKTNKPLLSSLQKNGQSPKNVWCFWLNSHQNLNVRKLIKSRCPLQNEIFSDRDDIDPKFATARLCKAAAKFWRSRAFALNKRSRSVAAPFGLCTACNNLNNYWRNSQMMCTIVYKGQFISLKLTSVFSFYN